MWLGLYSIDMGQQTQLMNQRHGDTKVDCWRGCGDWSGNLSEALIEETANGDGVNWICPECGTLVGTADY
jgi:hypothetical protein